MKINFKKFKSGILSNKFTIVLIILMIPLVFSLYSNIASAVIVNKSFPLNYLGMVGWWTMDGKNLINNVTDSSGSGNHGYMSGFTSTSSAQVAGKVGQGLRFDGVNDYTDISNTTVPSTDVTITFWFKTSSPSLSNQVILGLSGNSAYLCSVGIRNGYISYNNNVYEERKSTNSAYNDGKWHFVAIDTSNDLIYIDGVSVSTGTGNYYVFSGDGKYFGSRSNGGTRDSYYDGTLDDVRIYSRTLISSEILRIYNMGR